MTSVLYKKLNFEILHIPVSSSICALYFIPGGLWVKRHSEFDILTKLNYDTFWMKMRIPEGPINYSGTSFEPF